MSLLEDVFLENEAGEAQELERIIEGDEFDERPRLRSDSDENSAKEDEAEEDKRRIDPTSAKPKRVIKNPRFVLNPARLTGPRGIQVITEHFKDFKFKGKGHEREDLDLVLKKLEHWAYRLYPKFKFEDSLKKIETLGKKRPVAVHLHRIRLDQISSVETVVQKDSSDDEVAPAQEPEEDEFDKLLQQQIEIARATPGPGSIKKTPFSDRSSLMPRAKSSPSINDDQRERMLKNRKMAEERRLARLNQNKSKENINSSTKIDDVSKESKNKSVGGSSDDENDGRNKSVTESHGNKSDIVELDVDGMMVSKSPKRYIPAKKHKSKLDSEDESMSENVTKVQDCINDIVELDNDGKVVTKSAKRDEIKPNKNKNSRIDSSEDDDALVINEFDIDKHQFSRAKSPENVNKSNEDSSNVDLIIISEPGTIDVNNHQNGKSIHNRSNIIDSSDSEDEAVVMNESVTVDIHDSNKRDINKGNTHICEDSNQTNSVFDGLLTTENKIDVILEDNFQKENLISNGNGNKNYGYDNCIKASNVAEISIEDSKSQERTEKAESKNDLENVIVKDVDMVIDVDFSGDF